MSIQWRVKPYCLHMYWSCSKQFVRQFFNCNYADDRYVFTGYACEGEHLYVLVGYVLDDYVEA